MGNIKDIVDLARELESRAKTREDIAIFHRLNEMIANLREQHVEIQERDVQLMRDNEDLRRKIEDAGAEETRIHTAIEFRRGKRTGSKWMAFCPNCHMPALENELSGCYFAACSVNCGWLVPIQKQFDDAIPEIIAQFQA